MELLWVIIIASLLFLWFSRTKKNKTDQPAIPDPTIPEEITRFSCPSPVNAAQWKIVCFLRSEQRLPVLNRYIELCGELHASPEIIDIAKSYADMVHAMEIWSMPHPILSLHEDVAQYIEQSSSFDINRDLRFLQEYEADETLIKLAEERVAYWKEQYRDPLHDPVPTCPNLLRGTVVSVAGRFIQSEKLYQILSECGATFQKNVTDKTSILLQGSNPSIHTLAKVEKLRGQGCNIQIMKQAEFYDFLRDLHKKQVE